MNAPGVRLRGAVGTASALVRAAAFRVNRRTLGFALPMLALLTIASSLGLNPVLYMAPRPTLVARMLEVLVTGVIMSFLVMVADEAVERGTARLPSYAAAVAGGALIGSLLGFEFRHVLGLRIIPRNAPNFGSPFFDTLHRFDLLVLAVLVGGLATFVHVNRRTAMAARRRQYDAEKARAKAKRRTLESQLQALQARVEPMFLFDSLERIRLLYRSDVDAAGAILEDLILYLRAALPHMRESSSTVSKELSLSRSWLDIVGRSADGGASKPVIDLDAGAGDARLPALVLLPLVQHAISGAAADTGGETLQIRIGVASQRRLRIRIATPTDAFAAGVDGPPVLGQIDERLRALFGTAATFEGRRAANGRGSEATIELPLEMTDPHDAGPPP